MSNKVIVAGAPGFLGTKLVQELLKQGRKVVCIVHPSFRGNLETVFPECKEVENVYYKSILAPQEEIIHISKGAETFFNCAGMQHPKHTKEIYEVNSQGPSNLLQACISAKVKNFIHISSSTVCGSKKNSLLESDSSPGYTHYTKSKISGDLELKKRSNQGTKVVILMPTVFYGSPPSANLAKLMTMMKSGKKLPLISGGMPRSYVDRDKVVEAMLAAEGKGNSGDTFFISDRQPLTTKLFYESLGKGLGVTANTLNLPSFIARTSEKIALLLGKINIHNKNFTVLGEFGRPHSVNPEKSEKVLGLTLHKSSALGLEKMAKEFLDNKQSLI